MNGNKELIANFISTYSGTTFTDSRDGEVYKITTIGTQTWLAENLRYGAKQSCPSVYDCDNYGMVYSYDDAMKACPVGWHLPNRSEWELLSATVGSATSGIKLKAEAGWGYDPLGDSFNGTNDYGFAALPGGYMYYMYDDIASSAVYNRGIWWTATDNIIVGIYGGPTVTIDNRIEFTYSVNCRGVRDGYTCHGDTFLGSDYNAQLNVRCVKDAGGL
jgi:uncharacterized protein (TIGR02145 family)